MDSESTNNTDFTKLTPLGLKSFIESITPTCLSFISKLWKLIFPRFLQIVSVVWPISLIIMGIIYRNDCPYNCEYMPKILFTINLPIVLIMFGASLFFIISCIYALAYFDSVNLSSMIDKRNTWQYFCFYYCERVGPFIFFPVFAIVFYMGVSSIVLGTIGVYQTTYIPNTTNITLTFTNSSSNGYCNETFYSFSFWTFTSIYIILGSIIIILIIIGLCSLFWKSFGEFEKSIKDSNRSVIVKVSETKESAATELLKLKKA